MGSPVNQIARCASCVLLCLGWPSSILRAGDTGQRETAEHWANYYAAMYGVPPDLVHAIIEVESAWQPHAVSSKGAVGLMQLMPATAVTFGVTNRFVAQDNVRGGVSYLARLLKLFHGDLRLVTAAYLTGEARILSAGLSFSDVAIFQYVNKVALLYRQIRRKRIQTEQDSESRVEGGNSP